MNADISCDYTFYCIAGTCENEQS